MYCKYCGKQIPNGTSFCIYCGIRQNAAPQPAPVVETPIPAAPVPQPAAAPIPTPVPVETPQPTPVVPVQQPVQQPQYNPYQPQYAPQQPPQPQPPKKKSGGKTALIIILVLLLLGGLAVGGYFLYNEVIMPFLEDDDTSEDRKKDRDDDGEEYDDGDEYSPSDNENEDSQSGENATRPVNPDSGNEGYQGGTHTPGDPVTEPAATEPPVTQPPAYNPYTAYINSGESYILSNSDSRYLGYNDVKYLSAEALMIAEQEIHARHGRIASDSYLQEYFESRSWYTSSGRNYSLNEYEEANLLLLSTHQKMRNNTLHNSGNPYFDLYLNDNEYVISGSNNRYLRASDAKNLSAPALYVARNEIYARRGMIFTDTQLQAYFYTKSWYTPSTTIIYDSNLNQYEANNLVFIDAYTRKVNRTPVTSGTEYYDEYLSYGNREYLFSDSSYRYMSEYELYGMDADELELARNEIYARHGYTFSDQALREFFCTKSWYCPDTAVGDQSVLQFSSVELANIELMKNYENRVEYGEYQ